MRLQHNEFQAGDGSILAPCFWKFVLAVAVLPLVTRGEQAPSGPAEDLSGTTETLMLVREWDSEKGILTGWMPIHYAAIQLELLSKTMSPHFEPDEAVYLIWPRMRNRDSQETHLRVSPAPRTFEGESWLPVKRDPNLVRIGKSLYLVRGIILNGSKWRQPSRPSVAARASAKDTPSR